MPSQNKLIKQGIYLTDSVFEEIRKRLNNGVRSSDTLESFLNKTKDYTINNPLVVNGYKDELLEIILQETNNHKFSRPAQKELTRLTIENRVGDRIVDVGDDIKESVRDIVKHGYNNNLSQDEIAENISHRIRVIKNTRARTIARTEIARTATASDYVINRERGATHFTVDCRDTCCEKCALHYNWGKIEYSIEQVDMLPPFHPNCRCVAYFFKKDTKLDNAYSSFRGFKESRVRSIIDADNTYIEDLDKKLIQQQIIDFKYYTEGKPWEYCEIYDKTGKRIGDMLIGDEGSIPISWQELRELVHKGAFIVIHNHPSDFDNLHSVGDLITQLKSGIKYSVVESYTKRYIVVNTNNELDEKALLIKNLRKFEEEFYDKIDELAQPIISQNKEKYLKTTGKHLEGVELEDMKLEVKSGLVEEHYQEYEEGILNFFNYGTGLRLIVHDK